MSRTVVDFTADANKELVICTPSTAQSGGVYRATITVQGTFGGGTFTLQQSADNGVTKITSTKSDGSAWSATSSTSIVVEIPNYNDADANFKLYGNLTGATAPSLSVIINDNR